MKTDNSGIPASRANAVTDFPLVLHRVISFAISRRFESRLPTVTSGPPSFGHLGHDEKDVAHQTLTHLSPGRPEFRRSLSASL